MNVEIIKAKIHEMRTTINVVDNYIYHVEPGEDEKEKSLQQIARSNINKIKTALEIIHAEVS